MISLENYLKAVKKLAAGTTEYRLRGDCRNGAGDCVGLEIGSLRECGVNYRGLHSSNEFPRKYTKELHQIRTTSDLAAGMTVWKARTPTDSGYSLPDRYKGGSDLNDYYHQGVVLSVNPLDIVHVTSVKGIGGAYHDTKLGKWNYAGYNKWVNYDKEVPKMLATVDSLNDSGVNLRKSPSTRGKLLDKIPEGAVVTVVTESDEWAYIQYGGKTGYVMKQYLQMDVNPDGGDTKDADATITLTMDLRIAQKLMEILETALGSMGGTSK